MKVINRPPRKNPITAIKDGTWRLDNPLMAWPEVQPPAQRVPKPTRKPPTTKTKNPWKVNRLDHLKRVSGANPPENGIPNAAKSFMVEDESAKGSGLGINVCAIKPPIIAPITNTMFQICAFQSKSKNSMLLPAPPMEQKLLKVELTPKFPPATRRANIIRAIKGPDTYQGQAWVNSSIKIYCFYF